jgi:hypothetical protein
MPRRGEGHGGARRLRWGYASASQPYGRATDPSALKDSAVGEASVGSGEEQTLRAGSPVDVSRTLAEVGDEAGGERRDPLLPVLGGLDRHASCRLLDGAVDADDPLRLEVQIDRAQSDKLSPASTAAVLQPHRESPYR